MLKQIDLRNVCQNPSVEKKIKIADELKIQKGKNDNVFFPCQDRKRKTLRRFNTSSIMIHKLIVSLSCRKYVATFSRKGIKTQASSTYCRQKPREGRGEVKTDAQFLKIGWGWGHNGLKSTTFSVKCTFARQIGSLVK